MFKHLGTTLATLTLGLSTLEANAMDKFCHYYPSYCATGAANSVPELSLTAGPIAVAVILGIVGIGLERRRRKNKK